MSTLEISSGGILAAGTFSREIGLYANSGQGGCVASFCLEDGVTCLEGSGISRVRWSSCGTYILVGERNSNVIQVFDVRGQHRLLQTLVERNAESMMRLDWDLTPNGEVWAGGLDGYVRVWEGLGKSEGKVEASMVWKAHDGTDPLCFVPDSLADLIDPVVATLVHPSGSVAITCSAEDRNAERSQDSSESSVGSTEDDDVPDEELNSPELHSNIKIWSL